MGNGETDKIARFAYWGGLSWGMLLTTISTVYSLTFLHFELPSRPLTVFMTAGQGSTVPPLYDPYMNNVYLIVYLVFCVVTLGTVLGAALNKPYRYTAFIGLATIHGVWYSFMSPTSLFSVHFFAVTVVCLYGVLYAIEKRKRSRHLGRV